MSTRKTLAIGIGAAAAFYVLFITGITLAVVFAPPEVETSASAGVSPTATLEIMPTSTPAPTPTATTVQCPTDEEATYIEGIRSGMASYGTQLIQFGEDLGSASSAPWLFLDDIWQLSRETQLDVMLLTVERVAALQAPPRAGHIADQLDYLVLGVQTGLSTIRMSLQDIDGDMLEAGTAILTDQEPAMLQLGYDLDNFCG